MNDVTTFAFAVGDTVQRTTSGQQFIVDGFNGSLVICKSLRLPAPGPIHPEMSPTEPPVDQTRPQIPATELVKV